MIDDERNVEMKSKNVNSKFVMLRVFVYSCILYIYKLTVEHCVHIGL